MCDPRNISRVRESCSTSVSSVPFDRAGGASFVSDMVAGGDPPSVVERRCQAYINSRRTGPLSGQVEAGSALDALDAQQDGPEDEDEEGADGYCPAGVPLDEEDRRSPQHEPGREQQPAQ